ncbi:hypothetical protein T552_01397 [Pneumocystis carinii B80]|uniref:U3 small nucleolar ribonucleoprotein protein IMP3 n=1 Tax=Pneumocystis carinii (strain B80) TaxID=1408658 RepID=A0A0W4ZK77_PNEC8|nr:hypothetical protein T552_01397 [Pneumocystis carinii B80]KTW28767.1 hypothetical protein T552_01397 [Pneumocystis carinii B80]
MLRKLKYHEKKLLKKHNFLNYKKDDNNHRDVNVIRRYHVQKREDYFKYNELVGLLKKIAYKLSLLDPTDSFGDLYRKMLLEKLFDMGLLTSTSKLSDIENKLTVSAFCRRRLPIVMCRLKMCETVSTAVKYVEHGHVRVGPEVITDPAFFVTRNMEDFVTWVDSSKIKRNIAKYNDKLDDFDLLQI